MGNHSAAETDLADFAREFAERVSVSFVEGGAAAAAGLWGLGNGLGVAQITDISDAKRTVLSLSAAVLSAAISAGYNTARGLWKANHARVDTDVQTVSDGKLSVGEIARGVQDLSVDTPIFSDTRSFIEGERDKLNKLADETKPMSAGSASSYAKNGPLVQYGPSYPTSGPANGGGAAGNTTSGVAVQAGGGGGSAGGGSAAASGDDQDGASVPVSTP